MSLPRTQLNALHLPCILRAWRFLGPCFVISAVFLFFPCDLPIVSLVANAPREIRDVSMTNLHLQAETACCRRVHGPCTCGQLLVQLSLSPLKSLSQKLSGKCLGWLFWQRTFLLQEFTSLKCQFSR